MHLALLDRATGTSYDIWTKEAIIGRDSNAGVILTGEGAKLVSGHHARVFIADGKWWIEDSASRNGTFVHGSKIEAGVRHALHKGVIIGLGATGTRLEVIATEVNAGAAQTMLGGISQPPGAPPPPLSHAPSTPPPAAPRPMNAGATMLDPGAGARVGKAPPPGGATMLDPGAGARIGHGPPRAGATMLDPGAAAAVRRPAAAPSGKTVHVVLRDTTTGESHTISAPIVRLGRSLDCDVHIDGDRAGSVSRVHTEMLVVEGRVVVRDGGSRHGTMRNGQRLTAPAPLERGDIVALGPGGPAFAVDELSGGTEAGPASHAHAPAPAPHATPHGAAHSAPVVHEPPHQTSEAAPTPTAPSRGDFRTVMLRPALGHRSHKHSKRIRLVAYGFLAVALIGFGAILMMAAGAQRADSDAAPGGGGGVGTNRAPNWPQVARSNQGAVGVLAIYIGRATSSGTGFVISPSGYFVTTRTNVRADSSTADSIFVTVADQSAKLRADIVAVAPDSGANVAVLKIRDYRGPSVATIDWTGTAQQGEPAALIGFPRGPSVAADAAGIVRTSITVGSFSQVGPSEIQLAGFTAGASSGSPVLNHTGQTVGVYRGGLDDPSRLGLAVPMPRVAELLPPQARSELRIP